MKIKWRIFFLLPLVVLSCNNSPEPEVEEPKSEVIMTISGKQWIAGRAAVSIVENDLTGTISFYAKSSSFQKMYRQLRITLVNKSFSWLPPSPFDLTNPSSEFYAQAHFEEATTDGNTSIRFIESNEAVGLEVTSAKLVNGFYYLDGFFRGQPCGGNTNPNCLNIEGSFKNVRVFNDLAQVLFYLSYSF
uniref:hypothetical protein n=1 Tax=Roseivirga sp. TaxID=1964215 RepID=UPI0040477043